MRMIKGKPLIENATEPEELFTDDDLEIIKSAISRKLSWDKYGKEPKEDAINTKKAGSLLAQARLNGYYPAGISETGDVVWYCVVQPKYEKMRNASVFLQVCEKCGERFQAPYFIEEMPNKLCHNCDRAVTSLRTASGQESDD